MELNVRNVHYSIDKKEILKGVSLDVYDSQFVTIIGPNGCGKSTLLKNVYRVAKPSEGEILLNGKDINGYSLKESAKEMAVVSQFNELAFDCTVYDVVSLGRTPHLKALEREHASDKEIIEEAIKAVGLEEKKEQSYLSLSGGEKQRVVLARAIAQRPKLMILDEPTNHLDVRYQLQILTLVKNLGISVLAVLHDVTMAYRYSDVIYLMKEGKFIHHGPPNEVITKKNIEETFDVECDIVSNDHGSIYITYNERK